MPSGSKRITKAARGAWQPPETKTFADGLVSAVRHVLDMTPDLFFSAAEFLQALLDFLDVRRRGFFCFECVVVLFHGATL